ncbi:hypothetical protein VMT65_12130 [Nocardia sp. CDC153]|uniref:hypothetical protein n=1 Tax=Nocardia sp. CDC153 TaxID=3112167 RepID=UPI002DBE4F66|nr:hypothetical protein [Nocardia sp. CDC153]MEC3953778.1 hypothetical protein [Nocardia sp. CDC153]
MSFDAVVRTAELAAASSPFAVASVLKLKIALKDTEPKDRAKIIQALFGRGKGRDD